MTEDKRATDPGIEIRPLYGPADLQAFDEDRDLGLPGELPFTRGIYPSMYRGRLWTMRQYAGMGTAADTNARFRYLLDHGQTGLSIAFDLPTQMGYDSDHPRAEGEVGKQTDKYVGGKSLMGVGHYSGPCTPPNQTPHHYTFTLIATDFAPTDLPPGLTRDELIAKFGPPPAHVKGVTGMIGLFVNPWHE